MKAIKEFKDDDTSYAGFKLRNGAPSGLKTAADDLDVAEIKVDISNRS